MCVPSPPLHAPPRGRAPDPAWGSQNPLWVLGGLPHGGRWPPGLCSPPGCGGTRSSPHPSPHCPVGGSSFLTAPPLSSCPANVPTASMGVPVPPCGTLWAGFWGWISLFPFIVGFPLELACVCMALSDLCCLRCDCSVPYPLPSSVAFLTLRFCTAGHFNKFF